MYDSSRYISVAGHFWGQIWSCVVAPRQIPPHVDTGNLSRFPFGSRELDSIGKGAGMVQFAEGELVDRWPIPFLSALSTRQLASIRESVNRQRPFGETNWQTKIASLFGLKSTPASTRSTSDK